MAITDELREWATGLFNTRKTVLDIADRIDAAHEEALASSYFDGVFSDGELAENGFIRLPVDADGEYIRIGDAVTCGATVWTVTGLKYLGEGWGICCTVYNEHGGSGTSVYPPSDLHHHRQQTVEDVLREFAGTLASAENNWGSDVNDAIAEYAKRLKLAGEGE